MRPVWPYTDDNMTYGRVGAAARTALGLSPASRVRGFHASLLVRAPMLRLDVHAMEDAVTTEPSSRHFAATTDER
jgi:hypothetical protein